MKSIECQHHNNCGGWCETAQEQEACLCCDCLDAECEDHKSQLHSLELAKALQRIAIAAGIKFAEPSEIADIVCAKLDAVGT
jgi:hypothetical protein